MIQLMIGKKGVGKTKRIIDMANNQADATKGSVVYVDDDARYMYELKSSIRFIDASQYMLDSPEKFFGFIAGVLASNYDIETIYVDGFLKIAKCPLTETQELFIELDKLCQDTNLIICINHEAGSAPDFLAKYALNA